MNVTVDWNAFNDPYDAQTFVMESEKRRVDGMMREKVGDGILYFDHSSDRTPVTRCLLYLLSKYGENPARCEEIIDAWIRESSSVVEDLLSIGLVSFDIPVLDFMWKYFSDPEHSYIPRYRYWTRSIVTYSFVMTLEDGNFRVSEWIFDHLADLLRESNYISQLIGAEKKVYSRFGEVAPHRTARNGSIRDISSSVVGFIRTKVV